MTEKKASPVTESSSGDILSSYRGKVLLLLMGMPGCSGTEKATQFLISYAKNKPADVALLRVDVPPPEGEMQAISKWEAPFSREVDSGRKIADKLEFFYYPTLYILDRDGEVRFSGECKPEDVEKMVKEICSEKAGSEKHSYMPAMPKIGTVAEGFAGKTLDRGDVTLEGIGKGNAVFLFFGSTMCPFSRQATADMPALVKDYGSRGISFAIIHLGAPDEAAKKFYAEAAPGLTVIADESGTIGEKEFGVSTVPYFYLLDKKYAVVQRQPFTADSAKSALNSMLGIKGDEEGTKKPGAG
ncbi:MAG: TlpA family protein disulfide reductase [Vulcanimicrobiota bacterium]